MNNLPWVSSSASSQIGSAVEREGKSPRVSMPKDCWGEGFLYGVLVGRVLRRAPTVGPRDFMQNKQGESVPRDATF